MDINTIIMHILDYAIYLAVLFLLGAISHLAIKVAAHFHFSLTNKKVIRAVQAAESLLGAKLGPEKKSLVVSWLTKAFGKKLTSEEIEQFIQSAVFEMNKAISDAAKTADESSTDVSTTIIQKSDASDTAPEDTPTKDIQQEVAPAPEQQNDTADPAPTQSTVTESTPDA